jgi:hypothetical protein
MEIKMEAGRVIPTRTAAGEPQMGQVYDPAKTPSFAATSMQVVALDPTGAQMSNGEGRKATYSAATVAYAPYATPQDIVGIVGSASKRVRVLRFAVSGRATAANQLDVQLVKRSTADTGGTPTALVAVSHDSNDAAATAAVTSYGAAPTAGTLVGAIRAQQINLSAAGSGGAAVPVEFDFGTVNDKSIVLNAAAEGLYLNLNGAAMPAGTVLNVFVEWSEE